MEKIVHVCLHQRLIDLSLIEIDGHGRAIDHCVIAWTRLGGGLLQVVPMLDDLPCFKAEDIESDFRAKKIVISMSKNEIAVLKHAHCIDLGRSLWKRFEKGRDPSQAVAHGQVVLDVLFGVDIGESLAFARFYTLEKINHLLLVVDHGWWLVGSSRSPDPDDEYGGVAVATLNWTRWSILIPM